MSTTNQPTGPTGYTCAICDQFVVYGSIHQCSFKWVNPPIDQTWLRIALALERIADALEARLSAADGPVSADKAGER